MFATNMAAMNAARKQFGKGWQAQVSIEKLGTKEFSVQVRQPVVASGIALHTEREGAFAFPTAKAIRDAIVADARNSTFIGSAKAFFNSRPAPELTPSQQESADYDEDGDEFYNAESENAPINPDQLDADIAFAQAQELADKVANNAAMEGNLKSGKVWIRQSTILKPTKQVWHIADAMIAAARAAGSVLPTRKEVQDECVRRGIASGTARTQYQAWKKANDEARGNQEAAALASKRFNSK